MFSISARTHVMKPVRDTNSEPGLPVVKLFLCLISIVTRSHFVREMNQNPVLKLKNLTVESDLENFQDLTMALDAWL